MNSARPFFSSFQKVRGLETTPTSPPPGLTQTGPSVPWVRTINWYARPDLLDDPLAIIMVALGFAQNWQNLIASSFSPGYVRLSTRIADTLTSELFCGSGSALSAENPVRNAAIFYTKLYSGPSTPRKACPVRRRSKATCASVGCSVMLMCVCEYK